ncbi:2,5-diamino-6-(ribosylamino)-4(3H)-pyrimidinone 5'-phosphate reductase [Purpureocillium takamizusanense]|uniref:2,5-diamino-6-ribosylamino-4(3H)-pyrimidinone 5'-phosphate reductase n=1 Tax=Purpureocillium takamizusanense TaxID=2060973 RepID=A0A9Q8QIR2_9HYPO|nr:2,5-diamino-6-(ribosylamino)-4(3H)-pyrimidinone 5'-phosphate reductase [Purpureocillium takamizusanense]UNI21729.1 2,5-diamino-6-(ribosylamino)-4(3H)-pyrimidinone 5'-phosphate reductase [Purpureocillium takamizusanense]
MSEQLTFAASSAAALEPHLPPARSLSATQTSTPTAFPAAASSDGTASGRREQRRPFVTLTFATSLDSTLALAPGLRTRLSGAESKAMTHYLRSRHDAILVGVSTVLADDPGLNCRIAGVQQQQQQQPRPIVVDPRLRWTPRRADKVLELARAGAGLAPYVLTAVSEADVPTGSAAMLREHGGKYIHVKSSPSPPSSTNAAAAAPGGGGQDDDGGSPAAAARRTFRWEDIFAALAAEGLASVMVEGGGRVINALLHPDCQGLVDSVIVTIAPTWLGRGGVVVSPERVTDAHHGGAPVPVPAARLSGISWMPLGEDVVLCGRLHP